MMNTMPSSSKRIVVRRVAWGTLVVAIAATLALAWLASEAARRPGATHAMGPRPAALGLRDVPLRVEPAVHYLGAFDEPTVFKAVEPLRVGRPTSLSHSFHVLRLFDREATTEDPETGVPVRYLDMILNAEACLPFFNGKPTLIETREGVRCRTADPGEGQPEKQAERQAHSDQFLAVLAELGVPLNRPLRTLKGTRNVRAMLDDSLANFDIKAREIEWSVLAFALYLPPRASWTDKYKRVRTFDQLAEELMNRPYGDGLACGGTHLLYSLAVLLRADAVEPVLTPVVRRKLRDHLGRTAADLARIQSAEGWWAPRWNEHLGDSGGGPRSDTPDWILVLNTGHHLEWMAILPGELRPPRECFLRAGRWLQARLLGDPRRTIQDQYCPYSHAGRMLLVMSGSLGRPTPSATRAPSEAENSQPARGTTIPPQLPTGGGVGMIRKESKSPGRSRK